MFEFVAYGAIMMVPMLIVQMATGLDFGECLQKMWKVFEPSLDFLLKVSKWFGYYNELEENVRILSAKWNTLRSKAQDIDDAATAGESQNAYVQRKQEVRNWQENIHNIGEEIEIILQYEQREMNKLFRFLYRAWLGYRVERKIGQVQDLLESGSSLQSLSSLLSEAQSRITYLAPRLIGGGALNLIEDVLKDLRSQNISRIGIYGAAKSGKTAILTHVYNKLTPMENVYLVQLKETAITDHDLQTAIARELKLNLDGEDDIRRQSFLNAAFRRRGHFILILDGLRQSFNEENIGLPIGQDARKLVFTTPDRKVCKRMLFNKPPKEMAVLGPQEANDLFRISLQVEDYPSLDIKDIANEIILKCGYLPGKIIEVANELRGEEDPIVWRTTSDEL